MKYEIKWEGSNGRFDLSNLTETEARKMFRELLEDWSNFRITVHNERGDIVARMEWP